MMFMLVQVLIINLQMHLFYIIFTKKRNRKTVPFSFCFGALIRTAAQRLTVDEKSVSAENRGKMRGR